LERIKIKMTYKQPVGKSMTKWGDPVRVDIQTRFEKDKISSYKRREKNEAGLSQHDPP
jgi:hypothetical protein